MPLQLGLITHAPVVADTHEYIDLSLVNYKASHPEVMLTFTWQRPWVSAEANWHKPVITFTNHELQHMDMVSKIFGIIVRLKEKNAKVLKEPVILIRELKKKLARHVTWDKAAKEYKIVREKKNAVDRYQADDLEFTVSASTPEAAVAALSKEITPNCLNDSKLANAFAKWLASGAPVTKLEDSQSDVTPLSAYFRNGK